MQVRRNGRHQHRWSLSFAEPHFFSPAPLKTEMKYGLKEINELQRCSSSFSFSPSSKGSLHLLGFVPEGMFLFFIYISEALRCSV